MKYFSFVILFFITMNVYAIDFELKAGDDDLDGTKYYTLVVKNDIGRKNIDVVLEGNANTAKIREHLVLTCKWGAVEGVKVGMTSLTNDGGMVVDSYYFFDEQLNNILSKSYAVMNEKKSYTPLSLNHSVCIRNGKSIKKDTRTGKDYIQDYEVIADGPFALKGVPNVIVKYVTDNGLNFIKESKTGGVIVDVYKNKGNMSPVNSSVFFMNIASRRNIVNLISWGRATNSNEMICYKIYAYVYDTEGKLSQNASVANDMNLSGCEGGGKKFSYTNALAIKSYINKTYGVNN
ncbi:hypothetical protein LVQ78_22455 [Buttiauxella sp. A2-C2_NF]|uniref:hypothetical protein n=1 Tax=Buttiauxella ferragutiae TaxID=82989 RepID=UPI001E2FA83A|nr:hypothetical protein [Buttiauxella ferragutiae]MCE0828766.1 hypothetical protein [Buttiauxella ferragutiae]